MNQLQSNNLRVYKLKPCLQCKHSAVQRLNHKHVWAYLPQFHLQHIYTSFKNSTQINDSNIRGTDMHL